MSIQPHHQKNSRAAAVIIRVSQRSRDPQDSAPNFWILASATSRRPEDLACFPRYVRPDPYPNCGKYAFGPQGGARKPEQTILQCAMAEVREETAGLVDELVDDDLEKSLLCSDFVCRSLEGTISQYQPDKEYACITYVLNVTQCPTDDSQALAKLATQRARAIYASPTASEQEKRSVETLIFRMIHLPTELMHPLVNDWLPMIETHDLESQIAHPPAGYEWAERRRREYEGLDLTCIPWLPRSAQTLIYHVICAILADSRKER